MLNSSTHNFLSHAKQNAKASDFSTNILTKNDKVFLIPVLAKHKDTKRSQRTKTRDLFDLVVVEVEENESRERVKALDSLDRVVLVVEQPQLVFTLQQRTHAQPTSAPR